MDSSEILSDLLFEISNEDRYNILRIVQTINSNLTYISTNLGLHLSETRRHLARLTQVGLIQRNPNGTYTLTNYGNQIMAQIENIQFFTENKTYFETHKIGKIPQEFQLRLSNLSENEYIDNILNFIRNIEQLITNANEEIWMLVDQFPLHFLQFIIEAIERGVTFKILESSTRTIYANLDELASNDNKGLLQMQIASNVERGIVNDLDSFMIVSENECLLAFPSLNGEIDFRGFKLVKDEAKKWCKDLFNYYWNRISTTKNQITTLPPQIISKSHSNKVTVVGKERPDYDFQAIQDAVDLYDEVELRGRFNIGSSTIRIKRSVVLRGFGMRDDIPDTKLYKSGWDFPFVNVATFFQVRGENIDVTIENIHIENFNGTCIGTVSGNSLTLRKNRITLYSGLGRGLKYGKWGDHIVGIVAGENFTEGGFPGGILIEDNYLDFAISYEMGGFLSSDGRERDPSFRPDLLNHEAPVCVGIKVSSNKGRVVVRNNTVKNMNSRGILVCDNRNSSEITIHNNVIESGVFGAYPYNSAMSGVGIFIQSAWSEPVNGSKVEVYNNRIVCEKVNYCGIAIHGPSMYQNGAGKLEKCIIRDNEIVLSDGYIGIQLRKVDNANIHDNNISGKVYYGLQVTGAKPRNEINLFSMNNVIKDNDMTKLVIKEPDEYSNSLVNGYVFTGMNNKANNAHYWLTQYSNENRISIEKNHIMIDEGSENKRTHKLE
jgi:predicted transcriptional regulator